jgi:pilus assembly protein CpaF
MSRFNGSDPSRTLSDRINQHQGAAASAEPSSASSARHSADATGGIARRADPLAPVKQRLHQRLIDTLGPQLYDPHLQQAELEQRVRLTLQEILDAESSPLSAADRTKITQDVSDDILGHGPIEPLLRDPSITEVMANGFDQIYIERDGRIEQVAATFADEEHLRRTIEKIVSRVGRRIDEAQPMVDARLPDGSRVNAVVAPVALDGSMLTVRKFPADPFTDEDLIAFGTMTPQIAEFLSLCVQGKRNIVVSGGTGAGKTTFLNVMSGYIPSDERIVTIEDAAELQLHQRHVLRMEARPPNIEGRGAILIRDLVRNALRMRPDRIVVGEVRDGAALDMLQAMNTGHEGSLTTVHANSPRDSMSRIETMVLMAGVDLPVRVIREQIASAIDVVVQLARLKDGTRRVTAITEVAGMEGDVITMQDLFTFDFAAGQDERGRFVGRLQASGLRPHFLSELGDHGVHVPPDVFARTAAMGRP